ncbi:unnamed protein product [Paramecium primaurelia]|uniref:Uncharacterized protein n=1 Tax=Paramecium primaurelia TaxID=5886 RepID=A0A8S1Q8R9_PARPR|nr:unnamed protein product [Paramecium primaurelia]
MISYVVGLVQYNNQSPYYPAIRIKNNELQIRAMNDENKFEVISCRLDLPDLAIQWCYNQLKNNYFLGLMISLMGLKFLESNLELLQLDKNTMN